MTPKEQYEEKKIQRKRRQRERELEAALLEKMTLEEAAEYLIAKLHRHADHLENKNSKSKD